MIPEIDSNVQPSLPNAANVKAKNVSVLTYPDNPLKEQVRDLSDTPSAADVIAAAVRKEPVETPLPIGEVTGFEALDRTIDTFAAETQTISALHADRLRITYPDLLAVLASIESIRDRELDADVKLLETLDRLGAMVVTNRWMPNDAIIVTLPERFERVREEQARRAAARADAIKDHVQYAAPTPYVNLCNEVPMR